MGLKPYRDPNDPNVKLERHEKRIAALERRPGKNTLGAFAMLWYDSTGTISSDTVQTIPAADHAPLEWQHFYTTDPDVFSTTPDGAAGDSVLTVTGAGIIIASLRVQWEAGEDFFRQSTLYAGGSSGDYLAASPPARDNAFFEHVVDDPQSLAVWTGQFFSNRDWLQYVAPTTIHNDMTNNDESDRDILEAVLHATWLPAAALALVY